MSYGNERKKQIGYIYTDRGQFNVSLVYEERSVYIGNSNKKISVPMCLELLMNGMELRIKAEDMRGFIGALVGHSEEFYRAREVTLRQLESLGIDVTEF